MPIPLNANETPAHSPAQWRSSMRTLVDASAVLRVVARDERLRGVPALFSEEEAAPEERCPHQVRANHQKIDSVRHVDVFPCFWLKCSYYITSRRGNRPADDFIDTLMQQRHCGSSKFSAGSQAMR